MGWYYFYILAYAHHYVNQLYAGETEYGSPVVIHPTLLPQFLVYLFNNIESWSQYYVVDPSTPSVLGVYVGYLCL